MIKLLSRIILITPLFAYLTLWVVGISYEVVVHGFKFDSGGSAVELIFASVFALFMTYFFGIIPAVIGATYLFYMRKFGLGNRVVSLIWFLAMFACAIVYALLTNDINKRELFFLMITFVPTVPAIVFINFEQFIFKSKT